MEEDRCTRGVRSTADVVGHPIHPMIVPFPIALLIGAFVTDLVYLLTFNSLWSTFSFWLLLSGLITGVAAGVIGAIDFFSIGRARKHADGWVHAVGNASVVLLTLINLLLRWNNSMLTGTILSAGFALSAFVAAILVVTAWYGGELSYRHMIGVVGHGGEPVALGDEEQGQRM